MNKCKKIGAEMVWLIFLEILLLNLPNSAYPIHNWNDQKYVFFGAAKF
jgi:hypothetical protein